MIYIVVIRKKYGFVEKNDESRASWTKILSISHDIFHGPLTAAVCIFPKGEFFSVGYWHTFASTILKIVYNPKGFPGLEFLFFSFSGNDNYCITYLS